MTTQEHWIGHPTASRRLTDDGVLYQTPENQSLAVVLGVFADAKHLFQGANLWEIDGFVERLEAEADPAAALMRERLNKIRKLGEQGNWAECHPHADALGEAMQRHRDVADERHRANAYAEIVRSHQLAETQAEPSSEIRRQGEATVHRSPRRRHPLGHIIAAAQKATSEPDNHLAVWPELVRIAEQQPKPPAPLIGYASDEGVKYRVEAKEGMEEEVKFFTKDALRSLLSRKRRAQGGR